MKMSHTTLHPISENIALASALRITFQQWHALGAPLVADPPPDAVVDPEALLWFTLEVGRYDPRLFDEAFHWLQQNLKKINRQRLRHGGPKDKEDPRWAVLSAVEKKISAVRWGTHWGRMRSIGYAEEPLLETTSLFWDAKGSALPLPTRLDPVFKMYGLLRAQLEGADEKSSANVTRACSLLLRIRSILGASSAADILTMLLVKGELSFTRIKDLSRYSRPTVLSTLQGFREGGICKQIGSSAGSGYSLIGRDAWKKMLGMSSMPVWPDWFSLFEGLIILVRAWAKGQQQGYSGYSFWSEIRKALELASPLLARSGLNCQSPDPLNFLIDEFPSKLRAYLNELTAAALQIE